MARSIRGDWMRYFIFDEEVTQEEYEWNEQKWRELYENKENKGRISFKANN